MGERQSAGYAVFRLSFHYLQLSFPALCSALVMSMKVGGKTKNPVNEIVKCFPWTGGVHAMVPFGVMVGAGEQQTLWSVPVWGTPLKDTVAPHETLCSSRSPCVCVHRAPSVSP